MHNGKCQKWTFCSLTIYEHIFCRFALIFQVQLRSTEQAKAHTRSQWQKAQALRLKFLSSNLFEWFEHDLSDGNIYSQLLTAWGMVISCLMEMLTSLCVRQEMLECFQGASPDGARQALPRGRQQQPGRSCGVSLHGSAPRHGLQGVTVMGSPGCQESPGWDHVDIPTLC